jgi:pseudouridine-5'-phosphate glycosidase
MLCELRRVVGETVLAGMLIAAMARPEGVVAGGLAKGGVGRGGDRKQLGIPLDSRKTML